MNALFHQVPLCQNKNYMNIQNIQQPNQAKSEIKFKTEICKNWDETGKCNYGKKCRFAHGKEELQDKFNDMEDYSRYKSKQCNGFHQQGYCPYGTRCLFIHEGRNLDQIKYQFMYRKLLNYQEEQLKKRLPVFHSICRKKAMNMALQRKNEFNYEDKENSAPYSLEK